MLALVSWVYRVRRRSSDTQHAGRFAAHVIVHIMVS